jgi:hypothetical protein
MGNDDGKPIDPGPNATVAQKRLYKKALYLWKKKRGLHRQPTEMKDTQSLKAKADMAKRQAQQRTQNINAEMSSIQKRLAEQRKREAEAEARRKKKVNTREHGGVK